MSGYCDCACRDCFEVAISGDDDREPALCHACGEAGCEADGGECLAEGSYGGSDDDWELEQDRCLGEDEDERFGLRDEGREDFHSDG